MNQSIEVWLRILVLNPANVDACLAVAHYYFEKEHYEMAIPYYLRALQFNQNHPNCYARLGRSYFFMKEDFLATLNLKKAI
jgi:tetratricopeptide (TPR) repeat protein